MRSRLSRREISLSRREISALGGCHLSHSTTFSILHAIYEGVLKELIEKTFQTIQTQVNVIDFNNVG